MQKYRIFSSWVIYLGYDYQNNKTSFIFNDINIERKRRRFLFFYLRDDLSNGQAAVFSGCTALLKLKPMAFQSGVLMCAYLRLFTMETSITHLVTYHSSGNTVARKK